MTTLSKRAPRKAASKAAAKKAPAKKAAAKKAAAPAREAVKKARANAAARKPGRPSTYSEANAAAVCGLIAQGYTLRQIGSLPNMPDKSTIIRWLAAHEEFRDQYARANETRALLMADEILEIADDSTNDWVERELKDGTIGLALADEHIARSRVRIDARKWLMEKMAPKRYGRTVAVTGKDGGAIEHEHRAIGGILDDLGADGADTGVG